MAEGIEFRFLSNTRDVTRGVSDVVGALEDVGGALDDVGTASKDAQSLDFADAVREANRLDDALKDTARTLDRDMGADEVDRLERKMRDAERQADDLGDRGKRAGRDIDSGMDRAREGVDEFRDEANSTAREAAASFDGSAESIGDAFQEVAANAFAGFGPAGAAAGLLAAGGIGLAIAGIEDYNEAQEESKQRAAEWASAYIEAGGRILSASQRIAAAQAIITDPEQYATATRNAELWGLTVSEAVAAMTGDTTALAEAQRNVTAALEAEEEQLRSMPYDDVTYGLTTLNSEAREGARALAEHTGEMERGAEGADVMSQYLRTMATTTAGATREVDEFGDSVYSLPDGTTIYVDAETGQATQNVDNIERRIYGIPDATARVDVDVRDAQLQRYLNRSLNRTATVTVNTLTRNGLAIPY